ncbi:hypothetical protein QJQ45_011379 [Haematococcus lacustris]|nr:hypothetical protein QJQ45_011379 [Haematococcus lacustris]
MYLIPRTQVFVAPGKSAIDVGFVVIKGASGIGQQEDGGQGQGEQEVIAERRQVIKAAFQRIGESMQRPLELCQWEGLEALPPVGKEYQQSYKRVNDRLPKVKQRLHRAAEYRRGIDGRARNNP